MRTQRVAFLAAREKIAGLRPMQSREKVPHGGLVPATAARVRMPRVLSSSAIAPR